MMYIIIIVAFVILVPILTVFQSSKGYKKFNNELKTMGFSNFECVAFKKASFYIDTNIQKLAVYIDGTANSTPRSYFYDFDEIEKYDIIVNNAIITSGGISRAIVGGIIAGGVGAIVGAFTAKNIQNIDKIAVHVFISDAHPITLLLNDTPFSKVDNQYPLMMQNLEKLQNMFAHIIQVNQSQFRYLFFNRN